MAANYSYLEISTFRGLTKSNDVLSALPGQLSKNENYLYMSNGGLQERGGGAELTTSPTASSDPVFSLSNYKAPNGSEFLVTNQDSTVYYYNSGWNDLSMSLTADLKTRWEQAGFESNRALYGVNGTDSVIKVAGNTPVGSTVSGSPTDAIQLKLHKNRLFAVNNDDTLYFTEALDFDTWNTSTNTIEIAPGIDGPIVGMEVWGDALFIFKERGVYVLPNADSPVPKLNWVILRADAITGSQSTDTIKRTRVGIMYLSSDNVVRLISPSVSFSSGEYSLGGSGSPVVSEDINDSISSLLDVSSKGRAAAIVFNDLYILSFQSVNNSDTYNDITYFADTNKFNQLQGIVQIQPYWGEFTGFDYDFFTVQTSSNEQKIYGAKGQTGSIQETLNDGVNNDNSNAIVTKAVMAWNSLGVPGLSKRFNHIYFAGDTENYNIELNFNAYRLGKQLPGEGEGISRVYSTTTDSGAIVDSAIVGTDTVGLKGASSQLYRVNLRGNYFTAEFGNSNADEPTKVLKVVVYFRGVSQS